MAWYTSQKKWDQNVSIHVANMQIETGVRWRGEQSEGAAHLCKYEWYVTCEMKTLHNIIFPGWSMDVVNRFLFKLLIKVVNILSNCSRMHLGFTLD